MAETKRISDQYTISAPTVVVDGNLTVQGTTTSVETVNSTITDNILVLNEGETGSSITLGSSGIEIDRGSGDAASLVFVEADTAFSVKLGASLTNIKAAEPVDSDDAATKNYVDSATSGSLVIGGSDTYVQFNDSGSLGGDSNFTWNGIALTVGQTEIGSGNITTNTTNADLEFYASGSGTVYLRSPLKMENEISDPSGVSDHNIIYSKTPGAGESGLYFANTNDTDELISKSKAVFYSMIM